MNSILTAKELATKYEFAGSKWFYEFRELNIFCSEKRAAKSIQRLAQKYSQITQNWSQERNSEWICRTYLSAKMILSATLQLEAIEHAKKQNLRIVIPYLEYYTLLALLRAIIYTLPQLDWDDGKLVAISHQKAINLSLDHLSSFNPDETQKFKEKILDLKANRELISYKSPTSGDEGVIQRDGILALSTTLAEVAQLNSEVLERSILKNADEHNFVFHDEYASKLFFITIEDRKFFDREDAYRLNYIARKYPLPPNIRHIMTEGHVEDFFGSWCTYEENENVFDPNSDLQLIFDVP